MAEIPVERKRGIPPWAYLLLVVVLLAIVALVVRGCGTSDRAAPGTDRGAATIGAGSPMVLMLSDRLKTDG